MNTASNPLAAALLASSDAIKLAVWAKATPIPGYDPAEWRRDEYGNAIRYSAYGNRGSEYGWEKDHVRPGILGGGDHISNLRPLHWSRNASHGGMLGNILSQIGKAG